MKRDNTIRIVAISDTHGFHERVSIPPGDILIHAGDLTRHGELRELGAINDWLASLPHRHKIVVAGNHDFCFESDPGTCRSALTNATYLQDEGVEIEGLRFWGSPWQPRFFDWAFNLDRGAPLREKWDLIPSETDVLVTHAPPHGILDAVADGSHVGCKELQRALDRVQPRLHVFGHIHESKGELVHGGARFVNACICDLGYAPVNGPVVVDFP